MNLEKNHTDEKKNEGQGTTAAPKDILLSDVSDAAPNIDQKPKADSSESEEKVKESIIDCGRFEKNPELNEEPVRRNFDWVQGTERMKDQGYIARNEAFHEEEFVDAKFGKGLRDLRNDGVKNEDLTDDMMNNNKTDGSITNNQATLDSAERKEEESDGNHSITSFSPESNTSDGLLASGGDPFDLSTKKTENNVENSPVESLLSSSTASEISGNSNTKVPVSLNDEAAAPSLCVSIEGKSYNSASIVAGKAGDVTDPAQSDVAEKIKEDTDVTESNEEECLVQGRNVFDRIRSETEIVREQEAMEIASSLFLQVEESDDDTSSLGEEHQKDAKNQEMHDDVDFEEAESNAEEQSASTKEGESATEEGDQSGSEAVTETSGNLTAAQRLIQKFKLQIESQRCNDPKESTDRPKRIVALPAERKRGLPSGDDSVDAERKSELALETATKTKKVKVMDDLKGQSILGEVVDKKSDDKDVTVAAVGSVPEKLKNFESHKTKLQRLVAKKSIQKSYSSVKQLPSSLEASKTNSVVSLPGNTGQKQYAHANHAQSQSKSTGTVEGTSVDKIEQGFESKRGPRETVTMKVSVKIMCQEGPSRLKTTPKGPVTLVDKSVQVITKKMRADIQTEKEISATGPSKPVEAITKGSRHQSLNIREQNIQRLRELIKKQEKKIEMIRRDKDKESADKMVTRDPENVQSNSGSEVPGKKVNSDTLPVGDGMGEARPSQNDQESSLAVTTTQCSKHFESLQLKGNSRTDLKIQGGTVQYVYQGIRSPTNTHETRSQISDTSSTLPRSACSSERRLSSPPTRKTEVEASAAKTNAISNATAPVSSNVLATTTGGQSSATKTLNAPVKQNNPASTTTSLHVQSAVAYRLKQSQVAFPNATNLFLPLSNFQNPSIKEIPIANPKSTTSFVLNPVVLGSTPLCQPEAPTHGKPDEQPKRVADDKTLPMTLPKIISVRSLAGLPSARANIPIGPPSVPREGQFTALSIDQRQGLIKTLAKAKSLMCNSSNNGNSSSPIVNQSNSNQTTVQTSKTEVSHVVSSSFLQTTIPNSTMHENSSKHTNIHTGVAPSKLTEQASGKLKGKVGRPPCKATLTNGCMHSTPANIKPKPKLPSTYQKVILIQENGKFALMPVANNSDLPGSFFIDTDVPVGTSSNNGPNSKDPPPLTPIQCAPKQNNNNTSIPGASLNYTIPLRLPQKSQIPQIEKLVDHLASNRILNFAVSSNPVGLPVLGGPMKTTGVLPSKPHDHKAVKNITKKTAPNGNSGGGLNSATPISHPNKILASLSTKKQVSILPRPAESELHQRRTKEALPETYDTSPFWLTKSSKVKLQNEARIELALSTRNDNDDDKDRTNIVNEITAKYPLASSDSLFKIRFGALENQFVLFNRKKKPWPILPDPDNQEFHQLLGLENAVQRIDYMRTHCRDSVGVLVGTSEEPVSTLSDSTVRTEERVMCLKENVISKEMGENKRPLYIDQLVRMRMKRAIEEKFESMKRIKLADSGHDGEIKGMEKNNKSLENVLESKENNERQKGLIDQLQMKEIRIVIEDVMKSRKKS